MDVTDDTTSAEPRSKRFCLSRFTVSKPALGIDDMPPEILCKIFHYLPYSDLAPLPLVCQKWREVAYTPLLWSNFTLKLRLLKRSCKHCYKVLKQVQIKKVQILECSAALQLKELLDYLHESIKCLNLSLCAINHNLVMTSFANQCPQLVALDLSGKEARLNSKTLRHLTACTPNLQELSICLSYTFNYEESFKIITKGWRNLRILHISSDKCDANANFPIFNLQGLPLRQLTMQGHFVDICDSVSYFPSLEHVHILGCAAAELRETALKLNCLKSLLVRCADHNRLHHIPLVNMLAANSHNLIALDLGATNIYNNFPITIHGITENHPNLEVLILTNHKLRGSELKLIANGLKRLRFFEFSVTDAIAKFDIRLLVYICSRLTNLEMLVLNDKLKGHINSSLCSQLLQKYPGLDIRFTTGDGRSRDLLHRVAQRHYFHDDQSALCSS